MKTLSDSILEKLNNLIVIVNDERMVEYVAPSVKNILGFEPQDLLGDKWWEKTRENKEEIDAVKDYIVQLPLDKLSLEDASYERKLKTANGGYKWILWNISKGPDNSFIGVGYDITKRKNTERRLNQKTIELEESNKDILNSIQYAKQLQDAILQAEDTIKKNLSDLFILNQPRDIVSGDFYWYYYTDQYVFIAAIDCTGHGVPGAMMSVLGNNLLRDILISKKIFLPEEILMELDRQLLISLGRDGIPGNTPDGMDIALCRIDRGNKELLFAGAYRPLFLLRGGEIIEIKPDRYPLGFYHNISKKFTRKSISYDENDVFYIFSDGYIDQFGGEKNKKLNKYRFRELLLTIENMELDEQQSFLEYSLKNWMQNLPQTDDILVIGFKP